MSTDGKSRRHVVIKWQGRYLSTINPLGEPVFTWAPVAAKRFEGEDAARAFIRTALKFPGDFEVVDDPIGSKW
jgi:hypothetical protein